MDVTAAPASPATSRRFPPDERRSIRREVALLAWPVVVQSLFRTLLFLVDGWMLGHYGDRAQATLALAAIQVIAPLSNLIVNVLAALGAGTLAIIARDTGAGDAEARRRDAATATLISLVSGVVLAAIALPLLPAAGASLATGGAAAVSDSATRFLTWFALSIPFVLLDATGAAILRGAGDTRTPMVFALVANVINICCNYAFIFGRWGAPEMGVAGSGLATAISFTVLGLLMTLRIHLPGAAVRLTGAAYRLVTRASVARLLRVALPAAIEPVLFHTGLILFVQTLASLGTVALAAHRATINVESLAFMPAFGFSVAAGAFVGQCLGARRPDRAAEGLRASLRMTLLLLGVLSVLFLLFAEVIMRFFVPDNAPVEEAGALCLRLGAIELPFLSISMVLAGALRGAGDTRSPLVVSAVGVWLIRVPVAWFLAVRMGMGIKGAWITIIIDWAARAAVFWQLWRRGRWKTVEV